MEAPLGTPATLVGTLELTTTPLGTAVETGIELTPVGATLGKLVVIGADVTTLVEIGTAVGALVLGGGGTRTPSTTSMKEEPTATSGLTTRKGPTNRPRNIVNI